MPKLQHATPKYRHHRASGQAVVTLNGVDHYLGPWNSKVSKAQYDRVVGEWLAAGRRTPLLHAEATVVELCAAYCRFAQGYYRKDGQPTRSIERVRIALRQLRAIYGTTLVADFGPLALQSLQQRFVRDGKGRPWQHSTGHRTAAGKARAAANGKRRQTTELSVRERRVLGADVNKLCGSLGQLRRAVLSRLA